MPSPIPGSVPTPDELGHAGWTILHSAAAVFPHKPTPTQQDSMRQFITSWSQVYACSHCAYHMRTYLKKHPPQVSSKYEASRYVCEFHNDVNHMLGKETYDCSPEAVLKRWHPTFPNMDDVPTIEEQIEEDQRKRTAAAAAAGSGTNSGSSQSSRRWWGASSSTTSTPPAASSHAASASSSKRVADDETDVESVLSRLKGCQVYCPEKDNQKH